LSSLWSQLQIAAIEVLIWFSAVFSALLDNIPYTITMLPVIELLAAGSDHLDLAVLAWALSFGACFGEKSLHCLSGIPLIP